jgi:hypothetical protein
MIEALLVLSIGNFIDSSWLLPTICGATSLIDPVEDLLELGVLSLYWLFNSSLNINELNLLF